MTNPDVSEADVDESTSKKCRKCEQVKPLDEYHRRSVRPDGRREVCKACVREYDQARRAANFEKLNAQRRARYEASRDEIRSAIKERWHSDEEFRQRQLAYSKKYRDANPEAVSAQVRKWQLANPDKVAGYQRRWRERNPEKVREQGRRNMAKRRSRDPEGVRAYMQRWRRENRDLIYAAKEAWIAANYESHRKYANEASRRWAKANPDKVRDQYQQRRALKAGAAFGKIDLAEIWSEQDGRCGICGDEMDRSLRHPDPKSPSIDHIIPLAKGGPHAQDNVQWACLVCNLRKGVSLPD